MNRREAISAVGLLLGGTVIGSDFFLSGCKTGGKKERQLAFTKDDIAYLDEIADTILPATDTPGAKAAGVGTFMTVMVNDCYEARDQKVFLDGMDKINELSSKKYRKEFLEATESQRLELLTELDKEQKEYTKNMKEEDIPHYFRLMKETALLGYFTSEIGSTKALRYLPIPGRYDGNVPYKKGDRAWAIN
ncbi:MAG: gluconate 2-dehydrogenase subunit 3 family protein [Chitinophagaceae bacterium]|nr:gluconate 2-dehydrogenase subunit 3 family protein [Chitinophagaceae bacterium]